MEDRKEKNAPWLSVPQFGDWDQKGQVPDYSLDFSKIRENRKQNKRDVSRASLGNEEELIASTTTTTTTNTDASTTISDDHNHHYHQGQHSPTDIGGGCPARWQGGVFSATSTVALKLKT